jgi:hypothetical protein
MIIHRINDSIVIKNDRESLTIVIEEVDGELHVAIEEGVSNVTWGSNSVFTLTDLPTYP